MPVVLLHGLAADGETWQHVVDEIARAPVRIIVLDLLGFGESPRPLDISYSARDQARSVAYTLKKLGVRQPAMVVGHSMGCLVAVELATIQPKMVRNMLLYEPPFYVGLPERNVYRLRLKAYFKLFEAVLRRPPGSETFYRMQQLVAKRYKFELIDENWIPFERSLRNAIMQQTALDDLRRISTPTEIVYGRLDQWVINDKKHLFFDETMSHVQSAQITAQHNVGVRAAKVIGDLIYEAAGVPRVRQSARTRATRAVRDRTSRIIRRGSRKER